MLGAFAVGKTSLVARFVHSTFSEKYLTTIGVKIDRHECTLDDQLVNLVLWDIHGEDELRKVRVSYLRGMSGYLLVADGTRPETLETAEQLHQLSQSTVGDVPFLLLINKSDLREEWKITPEQIQKFVDAGWHVEETSAKEDDNVKPVFERLARTMLG